ncbi:hypothetical protein QR674_13690 [Acinetobacter chinensis]|uniref:Uncharacterized protein n=1 Tax=Acinetobacter chinensis TaxID=2004650 RepID=A0ABU3WIY9_9GAMM|nr:hypothetical protein [Acinetobacter chinensis]MDV2470033.1 hypothetical protein [Acinetobacter chinensis]
MLFEQYQLKKDLNNEAERQFAEYRMDEIYSGHNKAAQFEPRMLKYSV